jgi:osmoprotectant transport system permease protein
MDYIFDGSHWELSRETSIPHLLIDHLSITAISMILALVIAFPIALLAARYGKLYFPSITIAGLIYTIPSLAFMALLIPITGLSRTTVIIPLVLYAQVVLIRNIVAALKGVDPTLIEIGRAMGMTSRQVLLRVTLPLALPVIVAGIRVATVTTIGIATIAPLFGTQNLGYLIFQGFNTSYDDQVLAGVILVSVLAIIADLALLVAQKLLSRGRGADVVGGVA